MAQVILSKGADHLPLHRLEGIFQRQGVRISRQTMDGWWLATAEYLQPLYALAVRVVLASHVIHTDDTSVRVRDAWRKEKHTGRFWPYVGDALHPLTVFDYTTNHQRDGPAASLKDYRGYLQADAFVEDGWLDIDNNEGENAVRGIALGRKNWLFCGSDRGGRAAAIHFSLLASCKRHGHDPWVYYRHVLVRLPAMLPGASEEELLALLPHLWKPA